MADRANVTSLEVIEAFRSAIIVYITKARPVLEEVSANVVRTRIWLEDEQRVHWEGQLRLRRRALEQAQQTLFSARISNLRDESAAEIQAVHRAKRAVNEAEEKLKTIKIWARDYESRVQPLVKQLEKLHTTLSTDLPKGAAHLAEVVKALEAYADIKSFPAETAATPGSSPGPGSLSATDPPAKEKVEP